MAKKRDDPKAQPVPSADRPLLEHRHKAREVSEPFNPPEEKIGERIAARRAVHGLNFEQLARLTALYDAPGKGLTPAMLARYEKGSDGKPVFPGARELRLLCYALNVDADWLLLGIDQKAQAQQATAIADQLSKLSEAVEFYKAGTVSMTVAREREHADKLQLVRKPKSTEG